MDRVHYDAIIKTLKAEIATEPPFPELLEENVLLTPQEARTMEGLKSQCRVIGPKGMSKDTKDFIRFLCEDMAKGVA